MEMESVKRISRSSQVVMLWIRIAADGVRSEDQMQVFRLSHAASSSHQIHDNSFNST